MEHLPVILKKGRPFLNDLSSSEASHRAVCPRGKLLCFLDQHYHLNIHCLYDDEQSVSVNGNTFAGCQWVVPSTSTHDCVVDQTSQQKSEILAVSPTFNLCWYSVCEGSGGSDSDTSEEGDSETMVIENLAVMTKNELSVELRKLDHPDVIDSLSLLGSHEDQVLLLLNSFLLCVVNLDPEFGRISIQQCLPIEPTTDPYVDDSLPQEVGPLANFAFRSPLLFALTQDGLVFVYNVSSFECIGIINTRDYCQYMSTRQVDSEDLLTSVSSASFKYVAVSSDHTHLVAATLENNLLLVNLPDYFQMFPSHYNPRFVHSFVRKQRGYSHTPLHHSTIVAEEEGDRTKYGGLSNNPHQGEGVDVYPGHYGHSNRLKRLKQRVNAFLPSEGRNLNLHQVSHFPSSSAYETKRNELLKIPGIKNAISSIEQVEPSSPTRKPWFEEPHSQVGGVMSRSTFIVPFVTGVIKPSLNDSKQSSLLSITEEPLTPSRYLYSNPCILPALPAGDSSLVNVEFLSGMVVGYYGNSELEARKNERGEFLQRFGVCVPVNMLVIYRTETQSYSFSRLPQPSWLIHSNNSDQLLYLVNQQMLAVTTFNLSQEDFIGKVLMYGSANVAEELCHLNRWDKCSLPVNALETALELRQLDTLAFFLRSRDNGPESVDYEEGEVSQQTFEKDDIAHNTSLPPLPPEQLDTVVQLLIGAIRRNYVEEHYCQFASQLLLMTLGFLTRIIKSQVLLEEQVDTDALVKRTEDEELGDSAEDLTARSPVPTTSGVTVSLTDLTGYIEQLRNFLPKSADSEKTGVDGGVGDSVRSDGRGLGSWMFVDQSVVREWDKLSTKDVIKDALLKSCLPLAQTYLVQRRTTDSDPIRMGSRRFSVESSGYGVSLTDAVDDYDLGHEPTRYDASLKNMMTVATGFVMEALERRDLATATAFFVQMGLDVKSCLKHICFHTLSRDLRDFLAEELMTHKWLQPSEVEALQYLLTLETCYTVQCYDHAHSTYSKQHPRKMTFQSTVLPVIPGIVSRPTAIPTVGNLLDIYPETFGGDFSLARDSTHFPNNTALVADTDSEASGAPYLQVSLASVVEWDAATRQKVMFEGLVLRDQTTGVECERLVNREHVFDYYISRCDVKNALQFVTSRIPPLENHTHCPSHTVALCSQMPHATRYLQMCLHNELARHGVFLPKELSNLPSLLHRLGKIHSLFTHPHPLTKVTDVCEDGEDSGECVGGAVISLESFHSGFLKYLIDNRFCSLMYHYLDYYNLGLDEDSISVLGLEQTGQPWVNVLLQYRRAAIDPHDGDVMFQASVSCGNLLLSNGNSGCMTVMGMLQNGRTLMAIATLMFAPVPLEESMNSSNSHQPWYVDPVSLRLAVSAYPSLQAALFPPPPTTITPAQSQDISVYQLLQGSVPFNISRLFKWQSTNKSIQDETTRDSEDIPHFSAPALTDKFAFTEHLNYVYYLRRGQPSFAFANFVAAKLIGHSNTAKRVERAASRVYRLAMMDFTNSRLVSSCVAFIEMLERDSTLLRVDSQSALRMARHWSQTLVTANDTLLEEKEEESDRHKKIATQFLQLHHSPDNCNMAANLLSQLENSTHNMIASGGVELCGLEAEDCFSLVQSFCLCHQLPPSVAFLTVCCREGQWLPMLCQSQLHNIKPQKVLMIVDKNFSNPSLREHLHLAVSAMVTKGTSPTSPTQTGSHERSKSRRKRLGSGSKSKARKAENLVSTQPDLRAKFYSRVGLQRDVTPQPEPKTMEEELPDQLEEREEESGSVKPASIDTKLPPVVEAEEIPLPIEETDLPEDLFSALLKCQSHKTPWRALLAHAIALERPLLAILAACYEHSSMVDCLCTWLYCTLGSKVMEMATTLLAIGEEHRENGDSLRYSADLQWKQWTPYDLSVLLISALQHTPSPAASFSLGFRYFDKNKFNPVLSFMKFHEEFVLRSNYEECWKYLQEFNNARDNVLMHEFDLSIGDLSWVEQISSTIASHMLVKCPTPFERSHLLRLFSQAQFGHDFKCSVLNFDELHQMSKVLSEAGLASDAAFSVKEHLSTTPGHKSLTEVYSVQTVKNADFVLSLLLEQEQFDIARKYASIVHSTASQVTVKEAEHNLRKLSQSSTSYWRYEQARLNFWHQCNSNFQAAKVEPELAADFFESIVHSGVKEPSDSASLSSGSSETTPVATPQPTSCSAMERALLLAFALKWRKGSKTPLSSDQIREFEREIWLSHIHSTMETMEGPTTPQPNSSPLPFLPEVKQSSSSLLPLYSGHTSLLSSLFITSQDFKGCPQLSEFLLPENVSVTLEGRNRRSLSDKEGEALNLMLGRLLGAGRILQARELTSLFEHDSPDLTVVLCCIQLSQGSLTPAQLTKDVLSLVATRSPRHLSDPTLSLQDTLHNKPSMEIIKMLNQLSDRAIYAQACCSIILVCFKLALVLKIPYASIVTTDPFDTLTLLLSSKHSDKIRLASRFVSVCNLEPKRVAGYLSNCVAASLHHHASGNGRESPKSSIYHPQMTSRDFIELAQLCSDQTLLGNNLLSMAKSWASSETNPSLNLSIPVEFLIRAHDCFSRGCCVDGIADALVAAQQLVTKLMAERQFKLMVRLLTGISRYNEMSYIIGMLITNDEFENLVHTGVEKEEQLRIALLDYLTTHGNDQDKIQMVALKFGMFRELAKTREEQAMVEVRGIKPKQLGTNHPETVKRLKNAFECFRAASKTYAQEDCLTKAEFCFSQARLVALQLSVLQQGKQVINLDARRVLKYMEEQPFSEALIVSEAYRKYVRADWINPLYKKVIIGGDFRYLSDYKSAFSLTSSLVQELSNKYLRDKEKSMETTGNIKKLLTHLKNLPLKKKLALELGLKDVLQSMATTFDDSFLNDVSRL